MLRDEHLRAAADNQGTHVGGLPDSCDIGMACEVAFLSSFEAIRKHCLSLEGQDGLALLAIDDDGVAATAFLPRRPDGLEVAIVGRHKVADLWLKSNAVALRHLAIVLFPGTDTRPRYRVLDLRTHKGIKDERGIPLRSFEADGPVFFQLGRSVVLAFPTRPSRRWPEDPLAAWNALPPRHYDGDTGASRRVDVDSLTRDSEPSPDPVREWDEGRVTRVHTQAGVVDVDHALADGTAVGEIEVRAERGRLGLLVDEHALHAGVLLGRYDRCDNGGVRLLEHADLSRVHALVLQVQGKVHVIDTASTNGVKVRGERVRSCTIGPGDEAELGRGSAWIRWIAAR
jgi:hypothetical protein